MSTRTANIIVLILVVATFVAGFVLYPQLPDRIASNWNASGEADGYMGKFWGAFLLPVVLLGLWFLYWIVPKIDPLKANIDQFKRYYNGFWIFLFLFLTYIYGLQMAWNLGARFDFVRAMIPALSMLWYVVALVIENAKRNWFVGIRTPWTLSNDIVWERTHKLGGKLFKLMAAITLIGLLFGGEMTFYLIIGAVIGISIIPVVYSYVEYRRIEQG